MIGNDWDDILKDIYQKGIIANLELNAKAVDNLYNVPQDE